MATTDDTLGNWIGKRETSTTTITAFPMAAMAATLDKSDISGKLGAALPPLWHWLYFLDTPSQTNLAVDGHARRGDFLPPVSLPRRMWAGSRVDFFQPLLVGDTVQRESTIKNVVRKQGRSGELVFVTVEHVVTKLSDSTSAQLPVLTEQHDIVYREPPNPDSAPSPSSKASELAAHSRTVHPNAVLLFRYSALTFNSHRIHFDREFARNDEGYPGLVVHGPLLATLMVDLLLVSYPQRQLCHFEFKAVQPVFDLHPFDVCCGTPDSDGNVSLWVRDHAEALCMTGSARLQVATSART